MEYENKWDGSKYASKGVGGTALGLAIGALGVEALGGGKITKLFGNGGDCDKGVAEMASLRYLAEKDAAIARLETEVKLRDANTFSMEQMGKLRDYVDGRFATVEQELCGQRVYNATNTAAIGCIQGQIATLMSLTKTVVPNSSICPGWGNVTVTPSTTTTGA